MKYTKEEFVEWLNQHPEINSVKSYFSNYKSYNDPKLPGSGLKYYGLKSEDIWEKIIRYTKEEFLNWIINHPEIGGSRDYYNNYKSYNDPKLFGNPDKEYGISWMEIIPNINRKKRPPYVKDVYSKDEFIKFVLSHPEIKLLKEYKEVYKSFSDIKLVADPMEYYNMSWYDIYPRTKKYTEDEFEEWLENHTEIDSGRKYEETYRTYDDEKLPSRVSDYNNFSWLDIFPKEEYDYQEGIKIIKELGLNFKNRNEWKEYTKNGDFDIRLPKYPQGYFKNRKIDFTWGEWLGNGNVQNQLKKYHSYEKSKEILNENNINTSDDFKVYRDSDDFDEMIPKDPQGHYSIKGDWIDWFDFLGKDGSYRTVNIRKDWIKSMIDLDFSLLDTVIFYRQLYGTLKTNEKRYLIKKYKKSMSIKRNFNRVFKGSIKRKLSVNQDELFEKLFDNDAIDFICKFYIDEMWYDLINGEIHINDIIKIKPQGKWNSKVHFEFLKDYYDVVNFKPMDFYFKGDDGEVITLNLMQKLIVNRNVKNVCYANLSEAGTGKTIGDIVTSREIGSKITVIFAINSTLRNVWEKTILSSYPDSNVMVLKEFKNVDNKLSLIDMNRHNYIILNYEKLQLKEYSIDLLNKLFEYKIDKVTFDEGQSLKVSKISDDRIRRRNAEHFMKKVRKTNPNVQVSVLSATIVVNNLNEPKSMLTLLTGKKYHEIGVTKSLDNLLNIHTLIFNNSIRFKLPINMKLNEEIVTINGDTLCNEIFNISDQITFKNKNYITDFKKLLPLKLNAIKSKLKKGVIIYTHYVDWFVPKIKNFVENEGYSVGLYIGDDKSGYEKWKKKEVDILIASDPITTGVDGLQKPNDDGPQYSDTLILLTLPWTFALYWQLIHRIFRQGAISPVANIIIPSVEIGVSKKDKWKPEIDILNRIEYKKKLSQYALDSEIYEYLDDEKETHYKIVRGDFIKYLKEQLEFDEEIVREDLDDVEIPDDEKFISESVVNSEIQLAQVYNGENYVRDIINKPERKAQWEEYQKSRKTKHIKTLSKIILKNLTDDSVVVDAGCGYKAFMQDLLPCEVHSYDIFNDNDERIIPGHSIDNLPEENESVDVVIHSQVWEGVDFHKKVKEAHRLLKTGGRLYVVQSVTEWNRKKERFQNVIIDNNFTLINIDEKNTKYFITLQK